MSNDQSLSIMLCTSKNLPNPLTPFLLPAPLPNPPCNDLRFTLQQLT